MSELCNRDAAPATSPARAKLHLQAPAVDARRVRRVESDSGEGGARDDGEDQERAAVCRSCRSPKRTTTRCAPRSSAAGAELDVVTDLAQLRRRASRRSPRRRRATTLPPSARRRDRSLLEALEAGEVRVGEQAATTTRGARTPWVKRGILLGFRVRPARDASTAATLSFVDKDTYPIRALRRRRERAHRAGRFVDPARRVRRAGRRVHAADVRQRRRVRRRGHDGRFARADRIVRADRQARATSARRRRSAACSSR